MNAVFRYKYITEICTFKHKTKVELKVQYKTELQKDKKLDFSF